jgi:DMSO/TMAO reductase YedYZ molybdopterin-dependent catalytic subunit
MLHRRDFLLRSAALAGLPLVAGRGRAIEPTPHDVVSFPGMILRVKEPMNFEFPFSALDRFVLPTEQFFVRCHFPAPRIDPRSWRLKVEGAVDQPLELTLDDIRKMPSQTRAATLECAGNGRVYLTPPVRGVAWQLGAVGNAEWTGVPLAAVLERAGLHSKVEEVVLQGADTGAINDDPKTPGVVHYDRSLPIEKAKQPEVLLAYAMNGKDLPPEHGFPLRAVVPGWYGMASVKWLTRLFVSEGRYRGYFQTFDYSYFERVRGFPTMHALGELQVKASIARPAVGDIVPAKSQHRVFGAAWTGEAEISKVEVTTDGGQSWQEATLLEKPVKYAWRLWEYIWKTPERPGRYTLMARATDSRNRTQPKDRDPDRRTYMINHVVPVEVEVR